MRSGQCAALHCEEEAGNVSNMVFLGVCLSFLKRRHPSPPSPPGGLSVPSAHPRRTMKPVMPLTHCASALRSPPATDARRPGAPAGRIRPKRGGGGRTFTMRP